MVEETGFTLHPTPFIEPHTGFIDELRGEKNQLAPFIDDETPWTKKPAPFIERPTALTKEDGADQPRPGQGPVRSPSFFANPSSSSSSPSRRTRLPRTGMATCCAILAREASLIGRNASEKRRRPPGRSRIASFESSFEGPFGSPPRPRGGQSWNS